MSGRPSQELSARGCEVEATLSVGSMGGAGNDLSRFRLDADDLRGLRCSVDKSESSLGFELLPVYSDSLLTSSLCSETGSAAS